MTEFDNIVDEESEEDWRKWRDEVNDELDAVAQFVADQRGGGGYTNRTGYFAGSFNICIQFGFKDDGPDAIIRFPKKGRVAFRDEKVLAEVYVLKFIQEHTTIPIPRLISWGLTADSPNGLGPFIIMDFVEGVNLIEILRKPDDAKPILNPKAKKETLNLIYDQIANFMLQLDAFDFEKIGTLRMNDQLSTYVVGSRPWTYNMNEIVTSCGFPTSMLHTEIIETSKQYMKMLAQLHLDLLRTQRNLATDREDAARRYIARHLFAKISNRPLKSDTERFKLFCDDFRPGNILIDQKTLRITAVVDFEFTNALPAGFAESPPWWLLLVGPDMFMERGFTMSRFVELYEPQLDLFLEAMVRQEQKRSIAQKALSSRMRTSWESGDFWFFLAARKSLDVDTLFYEQLDRLFLKGEAGLHLLNPSERSEMEEFVAMKMKQKDEYDKEYAAINPSNIVSQPVSISSSSS